ncbi:MAG: PAS domain-containing protein [Candidatus Eisenbacteria bacterium]|nr:PAS domain-containing protein [Candidatus Latescibacterota bacterium]MBD3302529.1 PAS domain-containing protein [Candidatus Eisenbacteria bacterium]
MAPSIGRYLAVRGLIGLAVAGLAALPTAGADPRVIGLVLAWVGASTLLGFTFRSMLRERMHGGLVTLLILDLAVEAVLVAATGCARSPFVLVFSLTIATAGLFYGLAGGFAAGLGAAIGYWTGIMAQRHDLGIAPILTSVFLVALGILFGRVGRRVADQSLEMDRVRDELERVRLDAETIVASLTGPLLCLDRSLVIRRINLAASRLLGITGDPSDRRLIDVVEADRSAPLRGFVEETFQGGDGSAEIDLPSRNGGEPIPVEVSASRVRDRSGRVQGVVLLLADLTRRREQEAEQARKERLAAIGELSGHLAHEIRNSLKPVVGSIELLAGEIPPKGNAGELMQIILRESETLETFLNDFLAYSRDKSLTVTEFDLEVLIEEQVASLERHPARAPDVALRRRNGAPAGLIRADRAAVRDILRNLIINGLEATEKGSVEIATNGDAETVCIEVADTGAGLPDVPVESLFEPFRTCKPGGTGLGLSIARRLARRLGGEVTLEGGREGGTQSYLTMPTGREMRRAA